MADLEVRGLWQPQSEALLDICVIDTDAQSHAQRSVDAVLESAEREKVQRSSYGTTCILLPLCTVS